MKKVLTVILVLAIACIALPSISLAKPAMLPKGAKISRTIEDNVATITVTGVKVTGVEVYTYEETVKIGPTQSYKIDLYNGRRSNFEFETADNEECFVLLTPQMIKDRPDFLGEGMSVDCSDPRGCALVITK